MRILYLLCLALLPALLQADTADTVRHLQLFEVVAAPYREVIPAQKLSGAQLQRINSLSVADAIRFFSGVQIKDYGGVGGLKTVDIRSMGTHHMGVFYDGIQLGNAQNGQIDLGKFSLDNIEEITLYNGQKSEIFQPARDFGSAGNIYLKTRQPRFEEEKKNNLRFLFRTGSFDLINPSLLWERKISNKISSSCNVEYIRSSGKYKFRERKLHPDGSLAWDTTAIRQNGDIQSFRWEGGLYGLTARSKWQAKSYYYQSERGIPGAIINNVWKHAQRQWDRNFFLQGSFLHSFSPRYEIWIRGKYAHDYMRYLNPDTTLMYIDNQFRQQEAYLSVAQKFSLLPQWDLSLSTDYQWNHLKADLRDFVFPQRNTTLIALATAVQLWKIKMQASLLASLIQENVQQVSDNNNSSPGKKKVNKEELTPAIFLSYQAFAKIDLQLRMFYKKIFRMPTFNDLYYTDIGNVDLRPEYTQQWNVGLVYQKSFEKTFFQHLKVSADAYYNTVTDKIIAVPKGSGQYRWMMMNIGYVEIRGIDFSSQLDFRMGSSIESHVRVNYSFQKAQDFSDPEDNADEAGTYGGQIAYIPKHSASFNWGANYEGWDVNYSFIYVGQRYHNSSNIRENFERPWYTSDISLGKEFLWRSSRWKVTLEVNNLFNQAYDVVLNYPMPGTNCKIILRIQL